MTRTLKFSCWSARLHRSLASLLIGPLSQAQQIESGLLVAPSAQQPPHTSTLSVCYNAAAVCWRRPKLGSIATNRRPPQPTQPQRSSTGGLEGEQIVSSHYESGPCTWLMSEPPFSCLLSRGSLRWAAHRHRACLIWSHPASTGPLLAASPCDAVQLTLRRTQGCAKRCACTRQAWSRDSSRPPCAGLGTFSARRCGRISRMSAWRSFSTYRSGCARTARCGIAPVCRLDRQPRLRWP